MDRITRPQVLAFLNTLRAAGLAPAPVRGIYNQLRTIFRSAVHDRVLVASPCYKICLPKPPPKKLAFLSPGPGPGAAGRRQPPPLRGAGHRHRHRPAPGRAAGPDRRCGRPRPRRAHRAAAADDPAARRHAAPDRRPQDPGGAPRRAAAHLRRRRPARPPRCLRHRAGGLLFPNPKGAGWRRGSFNDSVWKPALRRAGLPAGFGMHACRHTYASLLIADGHHALVVMARLGHASITETMDTYGHLFPQGHAETTAVLDGAFGATRRLRRSSCGVRRC